MRLKKKKKTMQGRRQGAEQELNDHPDRWRSLLSAFGGQAEERGGCRVGGQEAPGFHKCNTCRSLKRLFSSLGRIKDVKRCIYAVYAYVTRRPKPHIWDEEQRVVIG